MRRAKSKGGEQAGWRRPPYFGVWCGYSHAVDRGLARYHWIVQKHKVVSEKQVDIPPRRALACFADYCATPTRSSPPD